MNKIHIVIPVFNGWKQTKLCLDALRASIYRDMEIIDVDHGSTDELINNSMAQNYTNPPRPRLLLFMGETPI